MNESNKTRGNVPRETSQNKEIETLLDSLCGFAIPEPLRQHCADHFDLMLRWNKVHNLTRITEPKQASELHYLDSYLPLREQPQAKRVADLGSGNGLPGFIAAALWPEVPVILVEAVAKKASFLRMLRSELSLLNLSIINGRCEEIAPIEADLVLTRATFPWPDVPSFAVRHMAENAQLLAYLGKDSPDSTQWQKCAHAQGLRDCKLTQYSLPVSQSIRHLASAYK